MRHVPIQPVPALRKRLRFAVNLCDFSSWAFCEQVVVDADVNFAADAKRQPGEHVKSVNDATVGAVFDRDDSKLNVPSVHFFEHRGDRTDGNQIRRFAKPFDSCLM